ncbi:hypothetical protein QMG61_10205 [Cryobacterium sp. PH31-AA6]|uniref:hypothetical protein n=1 Tax=Cryobacterium sp. PH31-AA6 TaxID=3046205 RepID=UPI0024B9D9C4|nr:hypothetical protein [Cryobacterium sp. PH31-AA6]MDJ0324136.1 hypothetical protein [Cryobacterium sp. PH31-AA6]
MSTASLAPLHLLAAIAGRTGVIRSRDATALGLERALRTEFERGRVVRLRAGAYALAEEWEALSLDARYLRRVQAYAAVSEEPLVFSHHSAAAIWGLPVIGAWPSGVDVLIDPAAGGRSRHGVTRHFQDGPVSIVERDGLLVTSPADTAVALARILPFPAAVAMLDRAIHRPRRGTVLSTRDDLERALAAIPSGKRVNGRSGAFRAADFATTESGSTGESVSRAFIYLLGFLAPELQVRFDDDQGFIAFVDFFWRRINRVGEFDGFGKYIKEEFTHGRTTAEVVMDEKRREDRVRACGPFVSRWDWKLALDPVAFGRFLARIGVPQVR